MENRYKNEKEYVQLKNGSDCQKEIEKDYLI